MIVWLRIRAIRPMRLVVRCVIHLIKGGPFTAVNPDRRFAPVGRRR